MRTSRYKVVTDGYPEIVMMSLPAGESVFSGIARAIIHNSDYGSVAGAQTAISRYFEERNAAFFASPRRAGRAIWGKERVPCKDPKYR